MGLSFVMQTAVQMYQGDGSEAPAQHQAKQKFDYATAVEKQRQEGGPMRYYDDGELDIESARVADEHGNPVSQEAQADEIRKFTHVNVRYCTS